MICAKLGLDLHNYGIRVMIFFSGIKDMIVP